MPIEQQAFEHSATVPVGKVIRQVPAYNPDLPPDQQETLHPDTIITVYYSLGPGSWFENTANADEASKTRYAMFIAVRMDFPSDAVRVWSGYGKIQLFGEVYVGLGKFGRVSVTPERSNLTFERKVYQLAGAEVNPALISEEDLEGSFGRPVVEYLGFLTEDGQLRADPERVFEGEISNILRFEGKESRIEVNAQNRLSMLDRTDNWRYTHEHQQEFYPVNPPDLGFNQVKRLETMEVFWGGSRVIAGSGGGGGRPNPPMKPL